MPVRVYSYTIYHSPNAYLGTVLLRRALAVLPKVELMRQPIFVPLARGVMIAEMLGGRENRNAGSYNREDCTRWANRYSIPFNPVPAEVFRERTQRWATMPHDREELPARAYYVAGAAHRDALDAALFEAAWVEGLDVNEPDTIGWAARRAGCDGEALLTAAAAAPAGKQAAASLAAFDAAACPGVPTVVVNGARYFGKDRVDWVVEACRALAGND